jgi:hypothetical protein
MLHSFLKEHRLLSKKIPARKTTAQIIAKVMLPLKLRE